MTWIILKYVDNFGQCFRPWITLWIISRAWIIIPMNFEAVDSCSDTFRDVDNIFG